MQQSLDSNEAYITGVFFIKIRSSASHSKSGFDANSAMGCKREQRVPKFQKRRRKACLDGHIALKGWNARFFQQITCGMEIIIHNMKPLL